MGSSYSDCPPTIDAFGSGSPLRQAQGRPSEILTQFLRKRSLHPSETANIPPYFSRSEMNKKKPASQIKDDVKSMCGMLKADDSVTKALLRERDEDKKREATKYGKIRRG